jgi:hypothetical protein
MPFLWDVMLHHEVSGSQCFEGMVAFIFTVSSTTYPATECNLLENQNPQLHLCKNLWSYTDTRILTELGELLEWTGVTISILLLFRDTRSRTTKTVMMTSKSSLASWEHFLMQPIKMMVTVIIMLIQYNLFKEICR